MAYTQLNATLTSTPIKLVTLPGGLPYTQVLVSNGHSSSIFVGGPSVATSNSTHGLEVKAGTTQEFWLHSGDSLYGICSITTGAGDVGVFFSGA